MHLNAGYSQHIPRGFLHDGHRLIYRLGGHHPKLCIFPCIYSITFYFYFTFPMLKSSIRCVHVSGGVYFISSSGLSSPAS